MAQFRCPRCGGTQATRWALPHPLLIHWILNPGLILNELFLGQRIPRETYFCDSCPGPKAQRAYVGCSHCGAWHSGTLWSQRRAFGHWLGYVCPKCGESIPCLWNVFSLGALAMTSPLWWLPVHVYGQRWRAWQRERFRGATPLDLHERIQQFHWVRFGVLYWGLPVGLLFSLAMAFFIPGRTYLEALPLLLLCLPLWLLAGVGWGLTMKWFATKWGAS
jgi:hypothetical protein